jgi:hypothetical protein
MRGRALESNPRGKFRKVQGYARSRISQRDTGSSNPPARAAPWGMATLILEPTDATDGKSRIHQIQGGQTVYALRGRAGNLDLTVN